MIQKLLLVLVIIFLSQSCATKKDILYFQDSKKNNLEDIHFEASKIQHNDILSIVVTTPLPEAAIPYNIQSLGTANFDIEALKLQGYLVSKDGIIDFPILGKIELGGLTIDTAEQKIKSLLVEGNHLKNASVNVRLLNAKVTILGDVRLPGTFNFSEQSITLPQALGYSGDLTITGKRKDIMIIREENGVRSINHIDLTKTDWFSSPYYYIKPNDVIVVNPNKARIKSAGFIGNAGNVLTIASLILSSIVLISR